MKVMWVPRQRKLAFRKQSKDARQDHSDFGELTRLRVDLNRTAMLFDDDVVADREPETGALARGFGCKEWIENLVLQIRRDAGAVVADADLNLVAAVSGGGAQGRLIVTTIRPCLTLDCRIEPVGDQVQQNPGDVLREDVGLAGSRIE